eukprot:g42130.t1
MRLLLAIGGGSFGSKDVLLVFGNGGSSGKAPPVIGSSGGSSGLLTQRWPGVTVGPGTPDCSRPQRGCAGIGKAVAAAVAVWYARSRDSQHSREGTWARFAAMINPEPGSGVSAGSAWDSVVAL